MACVKLVLAAALIAGVVVVTGCATPQDLEKLRANLASQMAQYDRAQQDRLKPLQDRMGKLEANDQLQLQRIQSAEQRIDKVAQIPTELDAAVNAVMKYARDVEKNIHSLRDLTARELDRQNTHIRNVKASYKSVLEQEMQAVDAMRKTLDDAMAGLKATLESSAKVLGEAIPGAEETVPPAPKLPKDLKIEGGEPKPPEPPPPPKP